MEDERDCFVIMFLMTAAATLKLRLRSSVAVLGTARSPPRSRFPRTKTGSAREIRRGHERNPVDYNVLGCLQWRVKQKMVSDVDQLKQRIEFWYRVQQTVVDHATNERRRRLQTPV